MDRKRASVLDKLGRNSENGKFAFGRWLTERNRFHGINPPSCFVSALALSLIVGSGMAAADSGGVYIHDKNRAKVDNDYDHIVNTHGAGVRIKNINGDVSIKNRYGDHWNDALIEGSDEGIKITRVRGDIRIDNRFGGKIIGHGDDGIYIDDARGDVRIDNRFGGRIYGHDDGVHIRDVGDGVKIDNRFGGRITGRHDDGIDIRDVRDDVRIENSFGGRITGRDDGIKIHDVRDDVKITNSHGGTITGRHGDGIDISDIRDDVTIDNHDGGRISGEDSGVKISKVRGDATISNDDGKITGRHDSGVDISDVRGDVKIDSDGGRITGGDDGVRVGDVRGDVVIHNRDGKITGDDDGVHVRDVRDDVIVINSYGGSIAGRSDDGVDIRHVGDDVGIDNRFHGTISGHDNGVQINDVDNVVIANGSGGSIRGRNGAGIRIDDADGLVIIDNTRRGRIVGHDDGIHIENADDDVAIDNRYGGRIEGERGNGIDIRNVDDDVWIDNRYGGKITGHDDGVKIRNVGDDVVILNSRGGRIIGERGDGVNVRSVDGDVGIDNERGSIQGRDDGIKLSRIDGDVWIGNDGGRIEGRRDTGVKVRADGSVTIDNGDGTIKGRKGAISIQADSATINSSGLIEGGGRHGVAIELSTGDGATINNYAEGLIRSSRGLTADVIIEARGGAVTINNDGTMIGRIDLSDAGDTYAANVFNNTSNDSWHFTGTSDLGGGLADVFNNTGTIYTTDPNNPAHNDITILTGVEYFNNGGNGDTGTINLRDGYAGDVFILRPTDGGELLYYGADGQSALKVDAFLGKPSNSISDTLVIEGDVTGTTAIYVNNVSSGFGAYNPYGTTVVEATGSLPAGSFFLANGPINTGLFTYDLYLNGSNEWVLASAPNQTFFELPSLTSAAQSIWHNAAGAWLDRTADLRTSLNETCAPVSLKDPNAACARPASGVWAKVLGSSESRSTNHAFTLMNSTAGYSVNTELAGGGVIGGYDIIRSTEDGKGIWMVGVMGGYLRSELNFDHSANSADFQSGAVGAYVTYLQGGWFIDGQFMANLGNVKYSGSQSVSEHSSMTAVGGVIDAGYRITRGNGFIEPGATLSYVSANIDAMDLYDTSVDFSNGDSLRGRLGVRVGTTIAKERAKYEPFIGVSALYEFLGNNTADVTSGDYLLKATDNRSGALGEVTGGVNVFSLAGNGLSAFAKGNVQFGKDDFVGYGGSLGVRVDW
ncbi:autotransporter domain-containing protein [Hyphomicrobium sp.]|uniref:autotransporter domain-containing protein n=1 Tax=Hyphomicrobium sp. TaxID=82 RepID=UPI000FB9E951|nr:autotransporter domain-containing protein [Hyphomicrobium sp.]RUP09839.1 MAG: autotransporter domain-containing protein [Hyphomicrobium sp.]